MLSFERKAKILELLRENQSATVDYLCKKLFASGATIRRDLAELDSDGLIIRVRGGATALAGNKSDAPQILRANDNKEKKAYIAKLALRYIKYGATMFFDSSSTVGFLAEIMNEKGGNTVITNGISTLNKLSMVNGIETICTGGNVINHSALVGDIAIKTIENYCADLLFFSCCGISNNGYVTEALPTHAAVKRAMLESSKTKILLCDSTKFGKEFFCKSCLIKGIDLIITDKKPSDEFCAACNCKVIY